MLRRVPEGESLVSVIVPVHNRAGMLCEAVESALSQTHEAVEVIVVDDGSTDATFDEVERLEREHPGRVRAVRQSNSGPGAARNRGLSLARGEFVQYLDSDDLLLPTKFETQVAALRRESGADLAYGITERVDLATGARRVWARTGERIECIFPDFLMRRGWDTNAPLWRRSACERIGPWMELRCLEDWEHDLRAGMLGLRPVHVALPGAIVRDHQASRASGMDTGFTVPILRDMLRAHAAVWSRMQAGSLVDWSYLESLSRKLFWLSRMCGERGLVPEAETALAMAGEMCRGRRGGLGMAAFGYTARLIGWQRTVRWSERLRQQLRAVPDARSA